MLTTIKKSGAPQATPIYYLYEDGKILISANKWKQKTLNVQRDPRVTLCVLQEEPRFRYLQVSGACRRHRGGPGGDQHPHLPPPFRRAA